ncbi:MAG: hypothetical protein RMA76_07720 [Deltaproteobacteria bacterium]|jgi:anti-sigma factor RsiW
MNERDEELMQLELLSAYVDGDLEGDALAEAEALLERSASARAAVEELEQMKAVAAEPSVTPSRDLWPDIAAELTKSAPANDDPRSPVLRVVIGALAVAAAVAVFAVVQPAEPPPRPTLDAQLASARGAYVAAIDRLTDASEEATARLTPETRRQLAASLEQVDRSIRDVERALQEAPEDPYGHETLLALYGEKVRILRAVIAAAEIEEDAS